ncbi:MAG: hypothetical protein SOY67_01265 [Collinsella sp.]|nr:hypothetical protein [Collinsella sp.]
MSGMIPFLVSGGAALAAVGILPHAVIDTGLTLAVLAGTAALAWRSQTVAGDKPVGGELIACRRALLAAQRLRATPPRTLPSRPAALAAAIERTDPC